MMSAMIPSRALPTIAILGLALASGPSADGATVRVPEDQATVQGAVIAAAAGDTVLVFPGRYQEIILMKPGVRLLAAQGPDSTVLVSPGFGETLAEEKLIVVPEGCDSTTVIEGFTLDADSLGGHGIFAEHASPTIRGNRIQGFGWGIRPAYSEALIEDNEIVGCSAFGILARGSSPRIFRNSIHHTLSVGITVSGNESRPVIGGSPENSNRFWANQKSLVNQSRNDIVATYNDWGHETTAEMEAKGYPRDILSIVDEADSQKAVKGAGSVDYRHWVRPDGTHAPDPSTPAPAPAAFPFVPVLVGILLAGMVVVVARTRRRAR
jgi:hypothetical protein